MAVDQGEADEHLGFEFETEKLGRVCCHPLNFKLLFRFTDLIRGAPDTVPDFICALLSVVGERREAASPEDRAISWEQAKALTDQELEQFAAKFLKAANWIGLGGRTQPTSEGADECSYSERLKRAFEEYEKGLAEEPSPLLDGFSDVVLSDSDLQRRLIEGACIEAAKPAFWDSVKKWRRAVGVASVKCTRFFANIGGKSQQQNSEIARHIEVSPSTPGALKQQLVNREIPSHTLHKIGEQLEKIRGRLKSLRAKADESANKVVSRRVLLGVVILAAIIGLWGPLFLYLIARANSRSQELAAIGNLTDTVRSLSVRMDNQTRELAELVKQHDSELRTAAQQTGPLDPSLQKAREKRPHRHSSLRGQQRKARNSLPSPALRLSHK